MDPDVPPLSLLVDVLPLALSVAFDPTLFAYEASLLVFLLLFSGLLSGSEVALFSLDSTDKETFILASDRASRRVLKLLETPNTVLVTILILNTLVNVGAAILGALMTAQAASHFGWPPGLTVVLEILILTFILLVISEITPKLIATQHPTRFSRSTSGILLFFHHVLAPITLLITRSMQFLHKRITASSLTLSGEDLKTMAEIGQAHGTLEEEERELIHSIIEFGDTTAREVMISRLDIVALPVTASLDEAMSLVRESGHSRLPLYVDHLDNILGIIYAKDLLRFLATEAKAGQRLDWTRIARKPMFIPLGKKLDDLLKVFQTRKTHIAIVVDEYGGTAGLVTMEDLLEEIVGEIQDEHDEPEAALYEQIDEATYRCDARLDLDDLNQLFDLNLDTESFDFETLGGLIFDLAGQIPTEGDELAYDGLQLRVETVENNRIGLVTVRLTPPEEAEELHAAAD